jgi:hypothetical protein
MAAQANSKLSGPTSSPQFEGMDGMRAKRSTAGKIRTNRFLDEDSGEDERNASSQKASRAVPSTPSSTSKPPPSNGKNRMVMRAPLPVHDGAEPNEGLWVGDCAGRWRGNKLYR